MATPRVRFAPSPTGHLHVGGARTALFNWLFARKHGGTFVLRIEDTDRDRSSEEMTRSILDALEWLGLEVDEGPFHQADGLDRHRDAAQRLLEADAAYRCFCPGRGGDDDGTPSGCESDCRSLDRAEAAARAERGSPHVVRFRVQEGETGWNDAVNGPVSFPNEAIEDFVLLRSDASPLYNLAVVSDDLEMGVTHVIRGDDHISNTPKQIMIYRALGEQPPTFAHVPMILGQDGKRLSKRHGASSVEAFREQGILPDAMVNFLALLGWSPGDEREVMDRNELIEAFSLDRILKKSAVFDPEKLQWINGQHISDSETEELAEAAAEILARHGVNPLDLGRERERFLAVLDVVKPRARTLHELARQAAPFFAEAVVYEDEARERFWKDSEEVVERLEAARELFRHVDAFDADTLEKALRGLAESRDEGAGALIHPLRVALMGVPVSPGIFTVLELMGRQRTLTRIDQALEELDRARETPDADVSR